MGNVDGSSAQLVLPDADSQRKLAMRLRLREAIIELVDPDHHFPTGYVIGVGHVNLEVLAEAAKKALKT